MKLKTPKITWQLPRNYVAELENRTHVLQGNHEQRRSCHEIFSDFVAVSWHEKTALGF